MIRIDVTGVPIPQGSMKTYGTRGGRRASAITADNPKLKIWRATVSLAARKKLLHSPIGTLPAYKRGATVAVAVLYRFALPQRYVDTRGGVRLSAPLHPAIRPDRDKCDRAIADALTAAGCVWHDDAQAAIGASAKVYVPPGEWTGAVILLGNADREAGDVFAAFVELLREASETLVDAIASAAKRAA